ncbi:MAG: SGNH/GDSL hydrolase family protein [Ignavibacteriae bacterium]|nr:SGNH/GDSL hydrolase family protein [Ignavibacteriota bacterium]
MLLLDRFIFLSEAITPSIYSYDNTIGRILIPNTPYLFSGEGLGMGSVNAYSYLGKEYSPEKRNGTVRIALLGDSYVESYQTFDRQYFGRILEDELKNKYNINAEVLNFGRSGFTMSDMYAYYENFVKDFKPDLVLFFVENNDFENVNKESGMPYPYTENDSLKIFHYPEFKSNAPWFLSLNQLSKYFPIFQIIRNIINLSESGQTPGILFGKLYPQKDVETKTVSNTGTDIVLIKIIETLSKDSSFVMVFHDKAGINPSLNSQIVSSGIDFIDVNDTLKVLEENKIDPYYWKSIGRDGHWNIPTHIVIGEFLARRLSEKMRRN